MKRDPFARRVKGRRSYSKRHLNFMPEQMTTRYLVCTKNRGFQRKHIDVCKRCTHNDDCREYQEYLRMEPVAAEPDKPAQKLVGISVVDLAKQLAIIRQLVGDGKSGYRSHRQTSATCRPGASLNQLLKAELRAIKSICQSNRTNPGSNHMDSEINPLSH